MRLFQWDRDFGVFFSTQGVSNIGDAAWGVLIPLYVLQLTHNPLQVSAIAIIEAVAFGLLRMPFGALADRLECRRLMIIADLGRTLLTLVIPVAAAFNADTLIVIYIVIVPIEAFSALFDSAAGAAVPMLVTEDKRGLAYAWQESFESLAWVLGPPLGGLLAVAFGTGKALGLDSITFLVSVAGLIAIRKRFEPAADETHEPMWASIRSGLRLMIADRVLRRDQLVWSLYSILGGSIVLGLVYVSTKGGRNDAALATLAVAAYAAGSAVGTMLAARFEGAPNLWLAEAVGLGVAAAGAALLAVGGVPAILAGGALFGLGEGLVLVFHLTLRARVTPDGYFGRITGVAGVVGQVTSGLSMVWLGLILRFAPGRAAFIVLAAAAAALAATVALAPKPQVQNHPDIERPAVPADSPPTPQPGVGQNRRDPARPPRYPAPVEIRAALEEDWPSIYPFYSTIMNEGRTYAFPEGQTLDEARPWWMEQPPGLTVVAVDGGTIVGSAKMGPNRPGRGAHVATASFIVDPAHRVKGVGRALGQYVIDWSRAVGYRAIQFNAVVEVNDPAVHLWTSLGFGVIGTVPEAFDHPDHGLVGLHVMYRRL